MCLVSDRHASTSSVLLALAETLRLSTALSRKMQAARSPQSAQLTEQAPI